MRRLPPFRELVAFEAVARHLSFTRAAAELCLTQSAVSHRVHRLEKYLGKPLFRRLNPGLALTEAGAALLPELVATLDLLARLGGERERRLSVAAASALCTWWLAGRLPRFMARRPDLSVELVPIESDAVAVPEVDIRILWVGPEHDAPTATTARLFAEQVFPVCSPRLLPNGNPLREVAALGEMPLLHKATHASGEWSWPLWLDRLGIDRKARGGAQLRFADMGLTLSAAVDGAGVALARSLLVHDALRAGDLVVPITGFEPMRSAKKHIARWPRDRAGDPEITAFVSWLVAEAARSLAETEALFQTIPNPRPEQGRTRDSGSRRQQHTRTAMK